MGRLACFLLEKNCFCVNNSSDFLPRGGYICAFDEI